MYETWRLDYVTKKAVLVRQYESTIRIKQQALAIDGEHG